MQDEKTSAERVLALLPHVVIPRLGEKEEVSWVNEFQGSLLFIDIAGFSSVACMLQKFTNEGAEALSFHLNGYFTNLIGVVNRHGGDVIFFSGDAMMVAWKGIPVPVAASTALSCGAALLSETSEYSFTIESDTGQPTVSCTMTLHIGGACGSVHGMLVGGKGAPNLGKWKYLLVGKTVETVGLAASAGQNGELVVTQELITEARKNSSQALTSEVVFGGIAFRLFKSFVKEPKIPNNLVHKLPTLSNESLSRAVMYVFDTVIKAVESAPSQPGELRTVSTAFIKLSAININEDPVIIHGKLNTAVGIIQSQLSKFDGILNKVMMDDKGIICLCLFGIPLHGHENDAVRAVCFAMKSAKKLHKAIGVVSIGISRATVFCGLTGSPDRNEYTVLGDGVNISARLMIKAEEFSPKKRHIIIDEETTSAKGMDKLSEQDIAIIEGDFLILKGQDVPVKQYHVVTNKDRQQTLQRVMGEECSTSDESEIKSPSSRSSQNSLTSLDSQISRSSRATGKNKSAAASLLNFENARRRQRRFSQDSESNSDTASPNRLAHSSSSTGSSHQLKQKPRIRPPTRQRRSNGGMSPQNTHNSSSSSMLLDNQSLPSAESITLYGRQQEILDIKRIADEWITKNDGCGASIILSGEAKIGKTEVLNKSCSVIELPKVYMPSVDTSVKEQYMSLKGLVMNMLRETQIEWLIENLNPEAKKHLPLLHHVVRLPEIPLPEGKLSSMQQGEGETLINQLVIELVKCQYGPRIILAVDDMQWLDDTSAGFISDAFDSGFFILGTLRLDCIDNNMGQTDMVSIITGSYGDDSEETEVLPLVGQGLGHRKLHDSVLNGPNCTTIPITPLNQDNTAELMKSIIECNDFDHSLVAQVCEKADGLPGCIIEMTRALEDEAQVTVNVLGTVYKTLDADVDGLLSSVIPDSMEAAVMRDVDKLSLQERKVISMAAVLGSVFHYGLLSDCLLQEKHSLDSVQAAFQSGILTCDRCKKPAYKKSAKNTITMGGVPVTRADTIRFVRSTARDVIYKSVLARERRRLHQVAAEILEKDPNRPLTVMVRHYRKAQLQEGSWRHIASLYKELIKKGLLEDALMLEAELIAFSEKLCTMKERPPEPTQVEIFRWALDAVLCLFESGQVDAAAANASAISFKGLDDKPHPKKSTKQKRRESHVEVKKPPSCFEKVFCCFPRKTEKQADDKEKEKSRRSIYPTDENEPPYQLQACLASIEISFFKGATDFTNLFNRTKTLHFEGSTAQVLESAIEIMREGSTREVGPPHPFSLFMKSPVSILATAGYLDYYKKLLLVEDAMLLPESLNLLPIQVDRGFPARPCIANALFSIRCVIHMLRGDGRAAFEDCVSLTRQKCKDERAFMYAKILSCFCSMWYCKSALPKHVKWGAERGSSVLDLAANENLVFPDVFLEILYEVYAETFSPKHLKASTVQKIINTPFFTVFHVMIIIMLLDVIPPDTKAVSKLTSRLESVLEHFPYAKPAYLYVKALHAADESTSLDAFRECIQYCMNEGLVGSVFAFKSACKMFVMENDDMPPIVVTYLNELDSQDQNDGQDAVCSPKNKAAMDLLRAAKKFAFGGNEVSILRSKVKLRRSRSLVSKNPRVL